MLQSMDKKMVVSNYGNTIEVHVYTVLEDGLNRLYIDSNDENVISVVLSSILNKIPMNDLYLKDIPNDDGGNDVVDGIIHQNYFTIEDNGSNNLIEFRTLKNHMKDSFQLLYNGSLRPFIMLNLKSIPLNLILPKNFKHNPTIGEAFDIESNIRIKIKPNERIVRFVGEETDQVSFENKVCLNFNSSIIRNYFDRQASLLGFLAGQSKNINSRLWESNLLNMFIN